MGVSRPSMGMSRPTMQPKGSKNYGVVIALFIALFIIGGGAAYFIIKNKMAKSAQESNVMKPSGQEEVTATKSLVELPPPLPEETPALPVIQEEPVAEKKNSNKKYVPATGTIDPKVARSFIKSNTNRVRNCYEKELKVNNILQGTVTTQIAINPDGSVANVKFVSDSVGSPAMRTCIKQEISSWTFPKPTGGRAEVQFPFRFEPKP